MEFVAHMIAQALQRIAEGDAAVWSAAWRTIRLAVESTVFALALGLPVGVWLGPVESRYGAHLVRLEAIVPGATPSIDDVRPQVMREFEMDRRRRALDAALREMRWRYQVVVEPAVARQASR